MVTLVKNFRTEHPDDRPLHPVLVVIYEDGTEVRGCGDSWCTGTCGLPAVVLKIKGGEFKAYSSMTACGPVIQSWRVTWTGERHELPPEQAVDLMRRMWW